MEITMDITQHTDSGNHSRDIFGNHITRPFIHEYTLINNFIYAIF
jgi:hypothetical protein